MNGYRALRTGLDCEKTIRTLMEIKISPCGQFFRDISNQVKGLGIETQASVLLVFISKFENIMYINSLH